MSIIEEENIEEIKRIRSIIFEVVGFIRLDDNYQMAANTLIQNNIGVSDVIRYTLRLSIFDIARLSDEMIALK